MTVSGFFVFRAARDLARIGGHIPDKARRSGIRGVAALLCAGLAAAASVVEARDFTVVGWGGATQETRSRLFLRPFAESRGIGTLEDVYLGGWGVFQAMKDTGQVPWDVVQVESSELMRGCEEGVFLAIDWARVADRTELIPEGVSECGVGVTIWAAVVGFNPEKIGRPPTALRDFWDLERWPGNRGLRQGPKINLELALMADGVAPSRVYEVLNTPEGVDRAFRKLDEIKPHLRLWKSGSQSQDLILSGEVAMSIIYNSRVIRGRREGLGLDLIWDGAVYAVDSYAILAGSAHVDLAHDYLRHFVASDRHLESMELTHGTTPIRRAIDSLDDEMLQDRPLGDNVKNAVFMDTDSGVDFWLNNQETLTQRWNTWVARE